MSERHDTAARAATGAFGPGFLWGVSTAGHQIEGFDRHGDTTVLENVTPTVFAEPSGPACDSWERWADDLDLVAGLGLTAYRFSVEWARIEPTPGRIDDAALGHYERIVDGCLDRGVTPIVTLSHFTLPHWFACRGAWLDPEAAELFARFGGTVVDRFGDRIGAIVTLNEPNLPRLLTWAGLPPVVAELTRATLDAASRAAGVERYRSGNVMVPEDFAAMQEGMTRAHRAAREAVRSRRPGLKVGLSIAMTDDVAEPGGERLRDRKRAEVYDHWLRLAAEDDFIGVQNYERHRFGPDGLLAPPAGATLNGMGTAVEPASLGGSVRYAHATGGVPVLVTEHGIDTDDDTVRAGFLPPSLDGLAEAISDGVPVLGYCHWTLMDNFEWVGGYAHRLGLCAVDRETFERTPKPSAAVYADLVARARGHDKTA